MIEFIVIVESSADARTATKLGDRVLVEKVEWLENDLLEHLFRWSGIEENTEYSPWPLIKKGKKQGFQDAEGKSVKTPRYLGHKQYVKMDGANTIKYLKLVGILQKNRPIRAVLFIRDLDHQPKRREGIEQARLQQQNEPPPLENEPPPLENEPPPLEIIIGTAYPMRESWVLNGFIPSNHREIKILEEIKAELTFNPCEESDRLRSKDKSGPGAIRNPKIVVEKLTGGDMERERLCWEETSLDILRARGVKTGLTAYLIEIEERLSPILSE